jgi:hypothetical protein
LENGGVELQKNFSYGQSGYRRNRRRNMAACEETLQQAAELVWE